MEGPTSLESFEGDRRQVVRPDGSPGGNKGLEWSDSRDPYAEAELRLRFERTELLIRRAEEQLF